MTVVNPRSLEIAFDLAKSAPQAERQAAHLLNQQIWCWGCDIDSPEGNLLLRHGFQRLGKPPGSNAASVYRLDLSPTTRIVLRGFGVFCGDDRWGGLFLRRFDFKPQLTPDSDLSQPPWLAQDLPPLTSPRTNQVPRCQQLLLIMIDWIHQYEVWVAENLGDSYRAETLHEWKEKNKAVPAERMPDAWRMLGKTVTDHPEILICRGQPHA